jgi:hypothetical protein
MANYRLFFIGRDDHIVKAELVDCPTDGDAIAAARAACREHPAVEVWELARWVERIDADAAADKPEPGAGLRKRPLPAAAAIGQGGIISIP